MTLDPCPHCDGAGELAKRDALIVQLRQEGLRNSEIAECLGVTTKIVVRTFHRLRKTGVDVPASPWFSRGHRSVDDISDLDQMYKVDEATGCWVWLRATDSGGYGKIRREGQTRSAHRWVYECVVGSVPRGLQLDHLCRNRRCVNPAHLEPVTSRENTHRGDRTRLTPADVEAIRASDEGPTALGRRYGVSKRHILHIRANQSWVIA